MKTVMYEPGAGEHIANSTTATHQIAKRQRCLVRFSFNGVILLATPKKSAVTLLWEYAMICGMKSDAYRMSKRGQEDRGQQAQQVVSKQRELDRLIKNLPDCIMIGLDGLVRWLSRFAEVANDGRLVFDHKSVAVLIEACGYQESEYVGNPPEWYDTRERMGRYITGQALNCLHKGFPPLQVTIKFCDDYFALPVITDPSLN